MAYSDTDGEKTGLVFNIQNYSVHDGPGIRTTVFLKGCPLACRWCCNPESQSPEIELAYDPGKCLTLAACGRCLEMCPAGAISTGEEGRAEIARSLCSACMACTQNCPTRALRSWGETKSVSEVLRAVERDGLFHARSGGGMTISGGEPLFQPEFALALLREARRRRIKTAVETCGYGSATALRGVCEQVRMLMFDMKTMEPERHKAFTGVDNRVILENFEMICGEFPDLPVRVRTPVVPGFNDSEKEIRAVSDFVRHRPNVTHELLPYHRLGAPKYGFIGKSCPMDGAGLTEGRMARLTEIAAEIV